MSANAFTVKDRTGMSIRSALHQLPFFDPDKRIPRGLEVMEFKDEGHRRQPAAKTSSGS